MDDRLGDTSTYEEYQDDPVAFGEKVLGETYTDDVKALMESVRDNPVTIARSSNAVGKTHCAARIAVWWYKCHADSQVYTAAAPPESNLKRLLWGEIGSLVEKHPEVFKGDVKTTLNLSRSAKSFCVGVTIPTSGTSSQREAKFSGKHAPFLLFIVDEGDAVPDEVYQGIESCMSGGRARLLIMFNPKAASGEPYRLERDRRAKVIPLSAFNHPNVITGENIIPGAVTRGTTIRRINEWTRPLTENETPSAGCFELPLFLEGQTAKNRAGEMYPPLRPGFYKIMDPAFSYMVLGEYPEKGSSQLISSVWTSAARSRWDEYVRRHGERSPEFVSAVMGQDVGEFGTDANVSCFRYSGYVERLISWGGIDTVETADKAIVEYRKRDVARANIDATGVGSGVAPHMQRKGCSATPVKVASKPTESTEMGEFKILRDQLWWSCREWLRTDPGAMLPPDEELIEELLTPTYEIDQGKIRVMKKSTMRELLKRSPDRADALCLTFYAGGFFSDCDLS
jgi:hypothetical protein